MLNFINTNYHYVNYIYWNVYISFYIYIYIYIYTYIYIYIYNVLVCSAVVTVKFHLIRFKNLTILCNEPRSRIFNFAHNVVLRSNSIGRPTINYSMRYQRTIIISNMHLSTRRYVIIFSVIYRKFTKILK